MARYQHRDRFYRKANEQGLPSRAAFKLEELLARFKLTGRAARVVDLGCAPGGWLAVLARAVHDGGRVVGIDIVECSCSFPNVITVTGDIRDATTREAVVLALGSAADLLTSDMAPKLSGIAERDQTKSSELIEAALDFARTILKPGGAMVAKVFMGSDFAQLRATFAREFAGVEVVRTRATRPGSSELYLVAQGFSGRL